VLTSISNILLLAPSTASPSSLSNGNNPSLLPFSVSCLYKRLIPNSILLCTYLSYTRYHRTLAELLTLRLIRSPWQSVSS
jgi:hypothetical protein